MVREQYLKIKCLSNISAFAVMQLNVHIPCKNKFICCCP